MHWLDEHPRQGKLLLAIGLATLMGIAVVAIPGETTPAFGDESPLQCGPVDTLDKHRYLRQLSLDLRRRIPTSEEYEALMLEQDVPESWIDEMLDSPEFYEDLKFFHRQRLLGAIETNVIHKSRFLSAEYSGSGGDDDTLRLYNLQGTSRYRGSRGVPCADRREPDIEAGEAPDPANFTYTKEYAGCDIQNGGKGCVQEGWVEVVPYWASDASQTVRVCAFDAQAAERVRPRPRAPLVDCNSTLGRRLTACGCGPDLRFCAPVRSYRHVGGRVVSIMDLVKESMVEEPLRIFEWVVRENRPYAEAFTTSIGFANGPFSHYLRNMAHTDQLSELASLGVQRLPDIPLGGDIEQWVSNWRAYQRGGEHAGVLTTAFFLHRHLENRTRANAFASEFLCAPFVSTAPLPDPDDRCNNDPSLASRCGCGSCHGGERGVEQMASYWGRWLPGGRYGYMEPKDFPLFDDECAACSTLDGRPRTPDCFEHCEVSYLTPDNAADPREQPWHGYLREYAWKGSPGDAEPVSISRGPQHMMARADVQSELMRCTAQKVTERLMHRALSDAERAGYFPDVVSAFRASGGNYKALVKAVVTSDVYRSVR